MKKFAYILMGPIYEKQPFSTEFFAGNTTHMVRTVPSFEAAKELVETLVTEGVGAIELCGAFGRQRAQELIQLTKGEIPISYVVHEEEQDHLVAEFFGG